MPKWQFGCLSFDTILKIIVSITCATKKGPAIDYRVRVKRWLFKDDSREMLGSKDLYYLPCPIWEVLYPSSSLEKEVLGRPLG